MLPSRNLGRSVPPLESPLSFWTEIKQRRITQIVLTYLAGGWLVLAVVDQVVDREVLPPVVYRVSLTLYLFGILVALILGWYHGEKGHQRAMPLELALLAVVILGGLGASARIVVKEMQTTAAADALASSTMDLRRIAVLYFQDQSADSSLEPVADALTEGLITSLAQVRELDVVSSNGSARVRDMDLSPDSAAAILDAGTLITGGVDENDGELSVTVRLLDGQSGAEIRRDSYAWPTDSLSSVGDRLSDEVSKSLRSFLGDEIRVREGRSRAPSTQAWLQLARGQKYLRDALASLARGDAGAAVEAFGLADEALSRAEALDTTGSWSQPVVSRGRVAYERFPLSESLPEAVGALDAAVALADSALAMEPNNAAALELRGTARYRRWLSRLDDDPDVRDQLLAGARSDLEQSVRLEPSRASAHSTLSHLYYQVGDPSSAVLAAQRAYEEDAFLSVADGVLWRLYSASYDLEQYDQARRWCDEGRRRFPDNFRFAQCQLFLMTMDAATPDVDRAWDLYQQLLPELPEAQRLALAHQAETVVGGIIGRAGMADSADAVLVRARLTPQQDPEGELMSVEAAMRALMGDTEGSIELLKRYVVNNPGHFAGRAGLHWWWRSLRNNPEFERLRALN
jgi:serine/threonine-protein kinase